jgi:hypothetical protein
MINRCDDLFFEWIVGGVRACPNAAGSSIQVACKAVAAAVGKDAGRLIRHELRWVNDLCLQAYFLVYMLAILYFQGFPGFIGHSLTPFSD